jgi:ubiquinone/menaquinone biosynthesis C-methylase UbiE
VLRSGRKAQAKGLLHQTLWTLCLCAGVLAQTPDVPYVASSAPVVGAMLKLAGVQASDVVYDLGCGDGRIVIAAAKEFGAHGVGIDINPDPVRQARANAKQASVEDLVRFEEGDLFKADIHDATVVTIYLMSGVNLRLKPKLLNDLKPGSRVVSHSFSMGDWTPEKRVYVDGSFLYRWTIPEKR